MQTRHEDNLNHKLKVQLRGPSQGYLPLSRSVVYRSAFPLVRVELYPN